MKLFNWIAELWNKVIFKFRKERIFVNSAQLSGDGSFVDIRYRLTRPDKAQGRFPVYLLDIISGEKLELMKMSRYGLVQTRHRDNQPNGILLFLNKNGIIKVDSSVSLIFGNLTVANIVVK